MSKFEYWAFNISTFLNGLYPLIIFIFILCAVSVFRSDLKKLGVSLLLVTIGLAVTELYFQLGLNLFAPDFTQTEAEINRAHKWFEIRTKIIAIFRFAFSFLTATLLLFSIMRLKTLNKAL